MFVRVCLDLSVSLCCTFCNIREMMLKGGKALLILAPFKLPLRADQVILKHIFQILHEFVMQVNLLSTPGKTDRLLETHLEITTIQDRRFLSC